MIYSLQIDEFPIHLHHLLCRVLVLESLHVFAATHDAKVALFGSAQGQLDGFGAFFGAVRAYVKAVRTARFLQTRSRSSHHRQSALYGFDDWNAESFVARGIDKRLCQLVNGMQSVVFHARKHVQTVRHIVLLSPFLHLVSILRASSDHHKMDVFGKVFEGFHGEQHVLSLLDGAHVEHEPLGKVVSAACLVSRFLAYHVGEAYAATLIDDVYALGIDATQLHNILRCAA